MSTKRRCISILTASSSTTSARCSRRLATPPQQCLFYSTSRPIFPSGKNQNQPRMKRFSLANASYNALHRHSFFTTTRFQRGSGQRGGPKMRQRSQPSMAVQQRKAQEQMQQTGTMLEYVGVLQDTFIMPTGALLPSFFNQRTFRDRLKLEYRRLVSSIFDFGRNWWAARYAVVPRLKLESRRTLVEMAKTFYVDMNTGFGKGDLSEVQERLSPGLLEGLQKRITARPEGRHIAWKLERYVGRPKLATFKIGLLPGEKDEPKDSRMGIIQAVVRIKSVQSLEWMVRQTVRDSKTAKLVEQDVPITQDGRKFAEAGTPETKTMKTTTEYVMLQKIMNKGKLGPWKLWGMAEETTMPKLKEMDEKSAKLLQAHSDRKQGVRKEGLAV